METSLIIAACTPGLRVHACQDLAQKLGLIWNFGKRDSGSWISMVTTPSGLKPGSTLLRRQKRLINSPALSREDPFGVIRANKNGCLLQV